MIQKLFLAGSEVCLNSAMDQIRKKINSLIESNYSRLMRRGMLEASIAKIPKKERKIWAENIVQEAILKTLQYIERGGCEPDNFVGFVKKTMENTINDNWKKSVSSAERKRAKKSEEGFDVYFAKKREEQFAEGFDDNIAEDGMISFKKSGKTWLVARDFGAEEKMSLEKCLDGLDKTLRKILIMNYHGGFSTKEIANEIQKPHGSVLRWLNQARIAFKTCFEGC